jgi:hypothetical protein
MCENSDFVMKIPISMWWSFTVLRSYLQSNVFYSVNEFVDHAKGLNVNKS